MKRGRERGRETDWEKSTHIVCLLVHWIIKVNERKFWFLANALTCKAERDWKKKCFRSSRRSKENTISLIVWNNFILFNQSEWLIVNIFVELREFLTYVVRAIWGVGHHRHHQWSQLIGKIFTILDPLVKFAPINEQYNACGILRMQMCGIGVGERHTNSKYGRWKIFVEFYSHIVVPHACTYPVFIWKLICVTWAKCFSSL